MGIKSSPERRESLTIWWRRVKGRIREVIFIKNYIPRDDGTLHKRIKESMTF